MKATAILAAKEAGKILVSRFDKSLKITNKKNRVDMVTDVDVASERKIVSVIKKKYQKHSFLTEEETISKSNSDYVWVIDPLDGTTNYTHGFPVCCISIALYVKDKPKLGVVYDPFRRELFFAEKGKGAFLNGKKIRVSATNSLKDALLVTGFYYDRGKIMRKTLKQIEKFFLKDVHGIRRLGSAALDLCYVAAGRFDGFWELKLSPWDFAAGGLIVSEAGGKITDTSGKPFSLSIGNVIASNKKLHREIRKVVE